MFWTALIWGIGVSLGANAGLFVFVFMFASAKKWAYGGQTQADVTERSLEALLSRNEIGEKQAAALERLAYAAEQDRVRSVH